MPEQTPHAPVVDLGAAVNANLTSLAEHIANRESSSSTSTDTTASKVADDRPVFRIVSEPDSNAPARQRRGVEVSVSGRVTTLEAHNSVMDAMLHASRSGSTNPHFGRRIISVEETYPKRSLSDEELTAALTSSPNFPGSSQHFVIADFEGVSVENDMLDLAPRVAEALRDSGAVPGLHLSVLAPDDDGPYSMIEIYDNARGIYLSRGAELHKITDSRHAVGWDGVLAIARELVYLSDDLH